jgi:3-oxoacyl-[acyl-carrier protein] reductase
MGAYYFARESSRLMKEAHSGKIINILSSYVLHLPPEKIAHYITANMRSWAYPKL